MFSLIITIVAIALVAALALATILYGGTAMHKQGTEAATTRILSEGQQIKGALTLYSIETNGEVATNLEALVSQKTLASIPDNWSISEGYIFKPETQANVCLAANKKIGVSLIPSCSDPAYASMAVCCSAST